MIKALLLYMVLILFYYIDIISALCDQRVLFMDIMLKIRAKNTIFVNIK